MAICQMCLHVLSIASRVLARPRHLQVNRTVSVEQRDCTRVWSSPEMRHCSSTVTQCHLVATPDMCRQFRAALFKCPCITSTEVRVYPCVRWGTALRRKGNQVGVDRWNDRWNTCLLPAIVVMVLSRPLSLRTGRKTRTLAPAQSLS